MQLLVLGGAILLAIVGSAVQALMPVGRVLSLVSLALMVGVIGGMVLGPSRPRITTVDR